MSAEIDTDLAADQEVEDPSKNELDGEWDESAPVEVVEEAVLDDEGAAEVAEAAEGAEVADGEAETEGEAPAEGEGEEALDELEAEELEMLTDDESSERISVDEAAELRDIRRAELSLDRQGADDLTTDEFVCQSCFLVLKTSQLASPRKRICKDCAA